MEGMIYNSIYHNMKRRFSLNIKEYQNWISDFYKRREWYKYDSFIRLNFLTEEVGELAQAVRRLEIGRDRPDEEKMDAIECLESITEELGDVLDNIFILADKYNISLEEIIESHKNKLNNRYYGGNE